MVFDSCDKQRRQQHNKQWHLTVTTNNSGSGNGVEAVMGGGVAVANTANNNDINDSVGRNYDAGGINNNDGGNDKDNGGNYDEHSLGKGGTGGGNVGGNGNGNNNDYDHNDDSNNDSGGNNDHHFSHSDSM